MELEELIKAKVTAKHGPFNKLELHSFLKASRRLNRSASCPVESCHQEFHTLMLEPSKISKPQRVGCTRRQTIQIGESSHNFQVGNRKSENKQFEPIREEEDLISSKLLLGNDKDNGKEDTDNKELNNKSLTELENKQLKDSKIQGDDPCILEKQTQNSNLKNSDLQSLEEQEKSTESKQVDMTQICSSKVSKVTTNENDSKIDDSEVRDAKHLNLDQIPADDEKSNSKEELTNAIVSPLDNLIASSGLLDLPALHLKMCEAEFTNEDNFDEDADDEREEGLDADNCNSEKNDENQTLIPRGRRKRKKSSPQAAVKEIKKAKRPKRGLERELEQLDYWGRRKAREAKRRRRTLTSKLIGEFEENECLTWAQLLRSFIPAALL